MHGSKSETLKKTREFCKEMSVSVLIQGRKSLRLAIWICKSVTELLRHAGPLYSYLNLMSSETLAAFYQIALRHITEDNNLRSLNYFHLNVPEGLCTLIGIFMRRLDVSVSTFITYVLGRGQLQAVSSLSFRMYQLISNQYRAEPQSRYEHYGRILMCFPRLERCSLLYWPSHPALWRLDCVYVCLAVVWNL
jgi:hypothetical protein